MGTLPSLVRALLYRLPYFAFRYSQLRHHDILLRIRKEGVWGCFVGGIWIIRNLFVIDAIDPSVGPS